MIGKVLNLAVIVGLIVGIWVGVYWQDEDGTRHGVDELYMNWALPPIPSPDQAKPELWAPMKKRIYPSAAIFDYGVEQTDKGWRYYWKAQTPWPLETVASWYHSESQQDINPGPHGETLLRWVPKGQNEGDFITITLKRSHGSSTTEIDTEQEYIADDQYLPQDLRIGLERIGLYLIVLGWYTLYKDRVVNWFARLYRLIVLKAKLPLYQKIGGVWYDPVRQGHWDNGQRVLEGQGFVKVLDCVHTLASPKEYGRVLHKHGQIYAILQFASARRKRHVWYEFFSLFADGSAVYTTTHRDPEFNRPKEYPLFQVPESADIKQIMNVHIQNVENAGKQLAMVAPNKILDVLSELERTVILFKPPEQKTKKRVSLNEATAKPQQLLPPPAPLPPPLEPPPGVAPGTPVPARPLPVAEVAPEAPVLKPLPTPVTAGLAQFVVNREASVLGIAAMQAEEKAEEHEALMAEKAAKEDFKVEVIARIKELSPNVDIRERNDLCIVVIIEKMENELDLETPYYMAKGSPDNRNRIITGVAMRVKQGVF